MYVLWTFVMGIVLIILGAIGYFTYRSIEKDKYELWKMRNELINAYEVPSRKLEDH